LTTYVDTSSLLKLVVDEDGSERAQHIWDSAHRLASVALVVVEARAALGIARRTGRVSAVDLAPARAELDRFIDELSIVEITSELIDTAADLAEDEGLRAYDAVHLAAALIVGATIFTSADVALCDAASRRGLHVANPTTG
jgi:uncharacterized protein